MAFLWKRYGRPRLRTLRALLSGRCCNEASLLWRKLSCKRAWQRLATTAGVHWRQRTRIGPVNPFLLRILCAATVRTCVPVVTAACCLDRIMDPAMLKITLDMRSATAACSLLSTARVTEFSLHDTLPVLQSSATAACSLVCTARVTECSLHDTLLVLQICPSLDMLPLHDRRKSRWRA